MADLKPGQFRTEIPVFTIEAVPEGKAITASWLVKSEGRNLQAVIVELAKVAKRGKATLVLGAKPSVDNHGRWHALGTAVTTTP